MPVGFIELEFSINPNEAHDLLQAPNCTDLSFGWLEWCPHTDSIMITKALI